MTRLLVDTAFPTRGSSNPAASAALAESSGYDAVWASEIDRDPFLQLGVATTSTSSIGLGTGIAVAFARNPMNTASLAHDLQRLSNGRFMLGLGTQVRAHITRRFSMPWSHPAARMREYVLAMRAIWEAWETGHTLNFAGEFYTHTLMAPMFVPDPHGFGAPPVIVAAVGELMTEVAGEVGDGMLCHSFVTERYLRERTIPAIERGRAKAAQANDFHMIGGPFIATGNTSEEIDIAVAAVRSQIAFYASTPSYRPVLELHGWGDLGEELHAATRRGEWATLGEAINDDVLHAFAAVGDPEEVGATLVDRFADVVDRIVLLTPYELAESARSRVAARVRLG